MTMASSAEGAGATVAVTTINAGSGGNAEGDASSTNAPGTSSTPNTPSAPTASTADGSDSTRSTDKGKRGPRCPEDVAIKQQRLKSWQPLLDPKWVIGTYFLIAVIFIPVGFVIRSKSNSLVEIKAIYEYHLPKEPKLSKDVTYVSGCEIGNNPNAMYLSNETCEIRMVVPADMTGPVMIHYELENFFQNHRRYARSKDIYQLLGSNTQDSVSASECEPLNEIGGIKINPCGLIANTLFNDVIQLESIILPNGTILENAMTEKGVAWKSDIEWKYKQPDGFKYEQCPSCEECNCEELNDEGSRNWSCNQPYEDENGNCFRFFYPNDETTQYLYETYPMVVNPIEGVLNEHFIVWMRTAALSHFRKLYGFINEPTLATIDPDNPVIPANSTFVFRIQANFAVERLEGSKALVVSETYIFGGKNGWLGLLFAVVGIIAGAIGGYFLVKELSSPRKRADAKYLSYKED